MVVLSLRINMYTEGLMDLMEMIMLLPFTADPKPKLDNIQAKATERYLPVFEKVSVCFLCEMVWSNNPFVLLTNLQSLQVELLIIKDDLHYLNKEIVYL